MKAAVKQSTIILILGLILLLAACSQGVVTDRSPTTMASGQIAEVALDGSDIQPASGASSQNGTTSGQVANNDEEPVNGALGKGEESSSLSPALSSINRSSAAAETGEELEAKLIQLYQQANPAVVYIIVPPIGSGSGFVYNGDGYIVTNNHVVSGGDTYEVVFADGEREEAKLVGQDVDSDLAVIKVDRLPAGTEPLPRAQEASIQVGQFVVAIGNPFGEQGSMSLGIVSGLDRSLSSQRSTSTGGSYSLPEVIQTDAPINPGNSGGPLLNLEGEVVGVNSAIASQTGTSSGVGFSVPVAAVERVVPSLINQGKVEYSYLGASFADEISLAAQEAYDLPQVQGAYVLSVTPGSPADRAGLVAANANNGRGGDLIVAIDDQPIENFSDLNGYLVFNTTVGQAIDVQVLRNGKLIDLSLTLGARPS